MLLLIIAICFILAAVTIILIIPEYLKRIQINTEKRDKEFLDNCNITYTSRFGTDVIWTYIDDKNEKVSFLYPKSGKITTIEYSKIVGLEVKVDDTSTNGIGRAVVGGLLFGTAGAVAGALTGKKIISDMKIVIYLNSVDSPLITLHLIQNKSVRTSSDEYKKQEAFANHMTAAFKAIMNKNGTVKAQTAG